MLRITREGLTRVTRNTSRITKQVLDPTRQASKLVTDLSHKPASKATSIQRAIEYKNAPETLIQSAVKREKIHNLANQTTDALSPGMQSCISRAYTQLFGKNLTDAFSIREFSTSSSNFSEIKQPPDGNDGKPNSTSADQWQPKSLADLRPPKEVADTHEEWKIETWKEVANEWAGRELTEKEHEDFRNDLRQLARDTNQGKKLCRIDTIDDAIDYIENNRYKGQHEKRRSGGESLDSAQLTHLAKVQDAHFGYPETTPANERPIHTLVIGDDHGGDDLPWINMYGGKGGGVASYFESHVEDCATEMASDSPLQAHIDPTGERSPLLTARAAPFRDTNENIWPLRLPVPKPDGSVEHITWNPLDHKDTDDMPIPYREGQIHRVFLPDKALRPKRDTSRIVIKEPLAHPQEKVEKLIKLCEENGIEWDVGKSKKESEHLLQTIPWLKRKSGMVKREVIEQQRDYNSGDWDSPYRNSAE